MKKKLISLFAAAAMMTSSAAAAVQEPTATNDQISTGVIGGADSPTAVYVSEHIPTAEIPFTAEIAERYGIEGAANIYYNSQYLDPAIIIQSRTMLPFRDFLETIGAAVTYDEKAKTVTAVRGETEISFTLDSDTIHIKNDLGEKDITMDVLPVVIEGNTYAPLRFLSEAFAMQVDWSRYQHTALIADFEKYYDELWGQCPNIMKIAEIGLLQPERAASSGKADIAFHAEFPLYNLSENNAAKNVLDIKLSLDSVGTQMNIDSDTTSTINFSYSESSGNNIEIKDASLDLIMKDETFYFRTDIGEQIPDIPPEAAGFLQGQWFKISFEDYLSLIASTFGSNINIEDMRNLLNHSQDPRAMMEYQIKTSGSRLYGTYSVDAVTAIVKLLAKIDSYINVAETGEDDYMITMKMNNEDLIDCIAEISEMPEDELTELRSEFNDCNLIFNIDLNETVTDKIVTAQKLSFEYSMSESDAVISITVNSDSATDPAAEIEDIKIPDNAADILEKIYGI
ncbi:MAG: copper amine oxidase N-terminal domain-containing protein [bacterium]|nr:copper amine oxidase N-terminal domain-containing protein [bacterium]